MSKYTPEVGDVWKDPCGQEIYIGSLGQQNVYLHWQDVKDICTKEVSKAYDQAKEENAKLKELLKECREKIGDEIDDCTDPRIELFAKINQALGEDK